jgi:hypothetical protein
MRAGQRRDARRCKGGEYNATKARGLGFALLQWFVDHVQVLRSRSDSKMLLDRAKEMRQDLLDVGWATRDLPVLEGASGRSWMYRWRRSNNIVMKACGMQLKVAWHKVCKRTKTLMTNIFRLKAFWKLVHPETELKFISADQKPSWFNNSGHTGTFGIKGGKAPSNHENFAKTRERYTILTVVPSSCDYGPETDADPPHVFVLFKGKRKGRILADVRAKADIPGWLHLQVQECGSYREVDVIEALKHLLPPAKSTKESMIVILDWFSAHRCDAVVNFIEGHGHIVLFHGGGCTPFTQVNDTHLHALLQRLLIQLENQLSHAMRTDMHLNHTRGIPTLHRHEIVEIVATAWRMLDHRGIARKGYAQTGPLLPDTGPIRRDQVYKDLRSVWDEIDPPIGMQEMGQKLRDDAQAFVAQGFPHKWSTWEHAKRLIIEHDDGEDAIPEGLEAFGYAVGGDDDDDDGGDDDAGFDDDDDDVADAVVGGDGPAGGGADGDDADSDGDYDAADDDDDDDDGDAVDGGAAGAGAGGSGDAAGSGPAGRRRRQ